MCVVSRGCGGLDGGSDGGGGLQVSHVRRCRNISRVRGEYTDYIRSHHHPGVQFWVGSSRNWSVFLEGP